ncbi:hypothetical protein [Kitasatospora sp. NPDC059571]|uniref:hypothetical protein n=1 Tax=Kitasatospora sp. NPDC059571 TaxID=3346871 RepID=UPI0036A1FE65
MYILTALSESLGELEGASKIHAGIRVEVQEQVVANADLGNGPAPKIHDPTVFVLSQRRFTHHCNMHSGASTAPPNSRHGLAAHLAVGSAGTGIAQVRNTGASPVRHRPNARHVAAGITASASALRGLTFALCPLVINRTEIQPQITTSTS